MNRWLPFEWTMAVRFLREGRLQTIFIIGGISIGVAVIVFMSAMLAGLQANFIKRVLTSQPQIQLLAPDQVARPLRNGASEFEDAVVQRPSQRVISIDQWPKIRNQMQAMPEVVAVSPTILGSVLVVRGDASRSVTLSGVEPDSYFKIVKVADYIVAGEPRLTSEDTSSVSSSQRIWAPRSATSSTFAPHPAPHACSRSPASSTSATRAPTSASAMPRCAPRSRCSA
jgi:lipoprotein-releasing system permease protein